jgi:hypothetical protein
MSEVKIFKPDKYGVLRKVRTLQVPEPFDFYNTRPKEGGNNIVKSRKRFKRYK